MSETVTQVYQCLWITATSNFKLKLSTAVTHFKMAGNGIENRETKYI